MGMRRWVLLALTVGMWLGLFVERGTAEGIEVLSQTTESHFPDDLTFTLQVRTDADYIMDAAIYYRVGWADAEQVGKPQPFAPSSDVTITYVWDTSKETVPPFVEVTYHWQVMDSAGNVFDLPVAQTVYEDDTHDWRSLGNEYVIVYWYDRADDFGEMIFQAAVEGYQHVAEITDIIPERPARVVIYNDQDDFCTFYAPRSCERWIGGQTFPGLTVQWGTNSDWLAYDIIPHELAHVFYNEVFQDTWVSVPTWFNEGIAVYNERTDHRAEMEMVKEAAANGELIPLRHMATQASGLAHDGIHLWYAEAYSLVAFIADVYGEDTLGEVILTLADNHPMEETLQMVLGSDLIAFEMEWREWLGYPVDFIPTPIRQPPMTVVPLILPTMPRGQPAVTLTPTLTLTRSSAPSATPILSPSATATPSVPASEGGSGGICPLSAVAMLAAVAWFLTLNNRSTPDC